MADTKLPAALVDLLDGKDLASKVGHTFMLCAADPFRRPRVALLSVGEILAPSSSLVRVVVHAHSRTTAALTASKSALIATVLDGTAFKIDVTAARKTAPEDMDGQSLAWFSCGVEHVDVDEVGYANLVSGITFELPNPRPVLMRWQQQITGLRHLTVEEFTDA